MRRNSLVQWSFKINQKERNTLLSYSQPLMSRLFHSKPSWQRVWQRNVFSVSTCRMNWRVRPALLGCTRHRRPCTLSQSTVQYRNAHISSCPVSHSVLWRSNVRYFSLSKQPPELRSSPFGLIVLGNEHWRWRTSTRSIVRFVQSDASFAIHICHVLSLAVGLYGHYSFHLWYNDNTISLRLRAAHLLLTVSHVRI